MNVDDKVQDAKRYHFFESARKKMDKIINTRITAAFIGAIAAFEEEFGFLWGHGVEYSKKTEEQKKMFELWNKARSRVLNNGNDQIRIASTELVKYVAKFNRYFFGFNVKEK